MLEPVHNKVSTCHRCWRVSMDVLSIGRRVTGIGFQRPKPKLCSLLSLES